MTEIVIIMLAVVIIVLYLLLKFGIIKRRVIVTIVQNLPIGIFKDKNKNYEIENKVYVKEVNKNEIENSEESKEDDETKADLKKLVRDDLPEEDNISESNENADDNTFVNDGVVYWTPKGKTYHNSKSCFALSRSRIINEGTVEESEKEALCDLCRDNLSI